MLPCVVSTLRNSTRAARHCHISPRSAPANTSPPRYRPAVVHIPHEHVRPPQTTPVAPQPERSSPAGAPVQHTRADTTAPDASPAPFAIDALHAFLAPANLASPAPITHTPRALLELYYAARARGDLRKLSAARFSALVAVLGALCAGARSPNLNHHVPPVLKHMPVKRRCGTAGWSAVLQVVWDKVKMKEHLHSMDAYWLMRARLALAGMEGVVVDPHEDDQLMQARKVYLHGDFAGLCVEAHIPYLRVLLASSRKSAHVELLGWLVQVMDRNEPCSKRTFALLSDVAMTEGFKVKGGLLAQLWRRALAKSLIISPPTDDAEPTTASWNCNDANDMLRELTALVIPNIRGSDLFRTTRLPSQRHIHRWAIQQAHDFFSPELGGTRGNRWLYLSLLAQANHTQPTLTRTALSALSSPTTRKLGAADFRIVAVLAIFERLVIKPVRPDIPPDPQLASAVRALWDTWSKAVYNSPAAPIPAIRPLLASFLRLAAATRDEHLRTDALRLAHTGYWALDAEDAGARRQVQALASAVAAAGAACGRLTWNELVLDFPAHVRTGAWQPLLAGDALQVLATFDGRLAHHAWAAWGMWIDLQPGLQRVLAGALLRDGDVVAAVPLLRAVLRGVRGRERWEPLGEVLLLLARRNHPYVSLELGKVISNSLLDVEEPEEVVPGRKRVRRLRAKRGPRFPSNEEIDEVLSAPYEPVEVEEEMQRLSAEWKDIGVYNADIDVSEALAHPVAGILETDAHAPKGQDDVQDVDHHVAEVTLDVKVEEVDTPAEMIASETKPRGPVDIPPKDFLGRISWALRALVKSGYPLPAILTFRNIILASPRYFGPEFIQDFLRCLLSIRHFRLAFRVLILGSKVYPAHVPKWHSELFFHFVRKGASDLAAHPHLKVENRSLYLAISKTKADLRPRRIFNLIKHRRGRRWKHRLRMRWLTSKLQGQVIVRRKWHWLLTQHRRWMAWGRMMRRRYRRSQGELKRLKRRERLEAFRIYRALDKAKEVDVRLLNYGMPLIARVRGVVPAGRLYARVARDLDWKTRTNLGNIIVHAQAIARKRGHRARVHRLREVLETLLFHYDFTPDRITTNIVVKALLGWRREVDTRQVRALVNQFVARGYPAGPSYSKKYLPFMPGVDGLSVFDPDQFRLPVHAVKLDFVRHVQPLYRMFIAAMHKRKDQRGVKVMKEILHQVRLEHLLRERGRRRAAAKYRKQKVN